MKPQEQSNAINVAQDVVDTLTSAIRLRAALQMFDPLIAQPGGYVNGIVVKGDAVDQLISKMREFDAQWKRMLQYGILGANAESATVHIRLLQ